MIVVTTARIGAYLLIPVNFTQREERLQQKFIFGAKMLGDHMTSFQGRDTAIPCNINKLKSLLNKAKRKRFLN